MFQLEDIMGYLHCAGLICIYDRSGERLGLANTPCMISYEYRQRMVFSVVQHGDDIHVTVY